MTTTKTLLLLRQTLARAKGRIRADALTTMQENPNSWAGQAVSSLLADIEQAIIAADREIERIEADQKMNIAAP